MKVAMDESGALVITPENNAEAFALKHWSNEASIEVEDLKRMECAYIRASKLIVICSAEDKP